MGWSVVEPLIESLPPFDRPRLAEVRGGFVRACRAGCDLRLDDESAVVGSLAVFMVGSACCVRFGGMVRELEIPTTFGKRRRRREGPRG